MRTGRPSSPRTPRRGWCPGPWLRVDRGQCDSVTLYGVVRADTEYVTPHDPLRVVCTGDWGALDPEGRDPRYVRTLLPRRTTFVRSTSSQRSEGQILAANVDHALIAVSLAVELDLGRVERFLALAWESGATPLVVLTKADLVDDAATLGHLVAGCAASAPGVQVIAVSATTGDGLDILAASLAGGTAVLLGQSGPGKSTLANALVGEDAQEVRATRDMDGKGRHTTTRNLLALPWGGVLIDTPGLRGVGLWDAEDGVARVFAEIEALAEGCRFPPLRPPGGAALCRPGRRGGRLAPAAPAGQLPQAAARERAHRRPHRRPDAGRDAARLEATAGAQPVHDRTQAGRAAQAVTRRAPGARGSGPLGPGPHAPCPRDPHDRVAPARRTPGRGDRHRDPLPLPLRRVARPGRLGKDGALRRA